MVEDTSEKKPPGQVDPGHAKWAFGAVAGPIGLILGGLLWRGEIPWWPPLIGAAWSILVVLAILGQVDQAPRNYIAGTLRKANFTQVYTFTTKRRLDWLWTRLCDPVDDDAGFLATFRAALTWRLYDRALLIAVTYPILLLVGWWIVGGWSWEGHDAKIGAALAIPAADFWPFRTTILISLIVLAILVPALSNRLRNPGVPSPNLTMGLAVGSIAGTIVFFAATYAGLRTNLEDGTEPYGYSIHIAFAIAVGFSASARTPFAREEFAGGGFAIVIVALLGALAVSGGWSPSLAYSPAALLVITLVIGQRIPKERPRTHLALSTIGPLLICLVALVTVSWETIPDEARAIFLCLGVLPLVNALFDVLSYAVTLTLMRLGLRAKLPLLYGLYDFAAALLLFLALGATLTAVIAGMNRMAGVQILDLGALFAGLHTDPHAYWWLYAMVFSTILPTALHACLSLLGAQGLVPEAPRRYVATLLHDAPNSAWKSGLAPLAVGTIWLAPFLVIGAILAALWWVSADALAAIGGFYLDTLLALATWIGAF